MFPELVNIKPSSDYAAWLLESLSARNSIIVDENLWQSKDPRTELQQLCYQWSNKDFRYVVRSEQKNGKLVLRVVKLAEPIAKLYDELADAKNQGDHSRLSTLFILIKHLGDYGMVNIGRLKSPEIAISKLSEQIVDLQQRISVKYDHVAGITLDEPSSEYIDPSTHNKLQQYLQELFGRDQQKYLLVAAIIQEIYHHGYCTYIRLAEMGFLVAAEEVHELLNSLRRKGLPVIHTFGLAIGVFSEAELKALGVKSLGGKSRLAKRDSLGTFEDVQFSHLRFPEFTSMISPSREVLTVNVGERQSTMSLTPLLFSVVEVLLRDKYLNLQQLASLGISINSNTLRKVISRLNHVVGERFVKRVGESYYILPEYLSAPIRTVRYLGNNMHIGIQPYPAVGSKTPSASRYYIKHQGEHVKVDSVNMSDQELLAIAKLFKQDGHIVPEVLKYLAPDSTHTPMLLAMLVQLSTNKAITNFSLALIGAPLSAVEDSIKLIRSWGIELTSVKGKGYIRTDDVELDVLIAKQVDDYLRLDAGFDSQQLHSYGHTLQIIKLDQDIAAALPVPNLVRLSTPECLSPRTIFLSDEQLTVLKALFANGLYLDYKLVGTSADVLLKRLASLSAVLEASGVFAGKPIVNAKFRTGHELNPNGVPRRVSFLKSISEGRRVNYSARGVELEIFRESQDMPCLVLSNTSKAPSGAPALVIFRFVEGEIALELTALQMQVLDAFISRGFQPFTIDQVIPGSGTEVENARQMFRNSYNELIDTLRDNGIALAPFDKHFIRAKNRFFYSSYEWLRQAES